MKYVLIAVALSLVLGLVTYDSTPFAGGDNYCYILLARSLQKWQYREIWKPDAPVHKHFPPGYPLILACNAPVKEMVNKYGEREGYSFSVTIESAKKVSYLCWLGFVIFFGLWLKGRVDDKRLMLILGMTVLSVPLLRFASLELSELPFLFFSMLSIFLWDKNKLWAGIVALFCVLIRPTGIALLLAMTIVGQKSRQRFLIPLAVMGLILTFSLSKSTMFLVNPYKPELGQIGPLDLPIRAVKNLYEYVLILLRTLKCW